MKFETPATTNPIDQLKVVGQPLDRVDGRLKTTGTARYAYEHHDVAPRQAYGYVVGAGIAKGRIASIDQAAAKAAPGVISIVTKSGRGLAKPEGGFRVEGGSRETATLSSSVRGAFGPAYGSFILDYNNTNGYNVARNGNERDGSRALTATAKVGADLTPAPLRAWI